MPRQGQREHLTVVEAVCRVGVAVMVIGSLTSTFVNRLRSAGLAWAAHSGRRTLYFTHCRAHPNRLIEADLDLRGGCRLGSASGPVDGLSRLGELFGPSVNGCTSSPVPSSSSARAIAGMAGRMPREPGQVRR